MKKPLATLCLGILLLFGCKEQSSPAPNNTDTLITSLDESILVEARMLCYDEIKKDSTHPKRNEIELDSVLVNRVFKILKKIRIMNNTYHAKDTIMLPYYWYNYYLNKISVKLDTNSTAAYNLTHHISPTGHANLDTLINKFPIDTVYKDYYYRINKQFIIQFKKEYNIDPMIEQWKTFDFVSGAEIKYLGLIGISFKEEMKSSSDSILIKYYSGSGDCEAGCMNWISTEYLDVRGTLTRIK